LNPAQRYYRRVIRMPATVSPNVRLALEQQRRGLEPTGEEVWPGVLTWDEYRHRRATWDEVRQCVGLDAEFYEVAELLLFPPQWLNRAEDLARTRGGPLPRRWMGIDPAEGGDRSTWAIIDRAGLLDLVSLKTPDTNVVPRITTELMLKWNVKEEDVGIDAGGGKTHADRLAARGIKIRLVRFGAAPFLEIKRGLHLLEERKETAVDRYVYLNLRAQMYYELSDLLDPEQEYGFALPDRFAELRRQLAPLPRWQDDEGRYYLPRKKRNPDESAGDKKKPTIQDMIGCSPDEADALAVATHVMLHKPARSKAGAA
jgi:hypothetical protein